MWESVPNGYKKFARKMTDEQLSAYIKTQVPSIDADSMSRALLVIKGR
jgi:hypothetical protein